MTYVWEPELAGNRVEKLHLKRLWGGGYLPKDRTYKHTVAWVYKTKDRKWDCQFVNHDGSRIFRTKREAMAYAIVVVSLS